MKYLILASALVLSACATGPSPYAPAESSRDKGFSEQVIETGRYRVSYKGDDAEQARSYALLRAADITLENDADWFRVVDAYTEVDGRRSGGSSVSVGGSSGSYGSGVGVGVGIGLPLGGGGSSDATHTLEMVIFKGEKPDDPDAYDAASVQASILGAPQP